MSQFNLIDEAWIPVRRLDGTRVELGIGEVLRQAKDLAVIEDPSPLVTAALHRFLLAVLYRALEGPTDIDQAKALFKAGLPMDKIDAYLERWRDRFWLFDEQYPFFQIPDFEPKVWRAWTVLAAEHNADNAKVLFDHIDVTRPDAVTPAAAARWLLATQTFSVSAGKSELSHTGTAPAATAAMVLPLGRQLEDTLLLNLVPQHRAVLAGDLPVWEREPDALARLKAGAERGIAGYADRYTWRTRSIRLRGENDGGVSTLAFASGVENATKASIDPMLAYRIDEEKGPRSIQFSDRGLWREFHSLLPNRDAKKHLAPSVIQHAVELTRYAKGRFPTSSMVLGLSNVPGQAKINFWRSERFALPETLVAENGSPYWEIKELLDKAELTHASAKAACETFARSMLGHGERKIVAKDVTEFVRQMPVSAAYWSTLEAAFHDVLRHYTADSDPDAIRLGWLKTVRKTLRTAWQQHAASVSTGDAWAIRALVRAEAHVNKQVGVLNKEIQQYETHHQTQSPSQEVPA